MAGYIVSDVKGRGGGDESETVNKTKLAKEERRERGIVEVSSGRYGVILCTAVQNKNVELRFHLLFTEFY